MRTKPKLVCFSYAGGNASFFETIEKDLSEIELVKMEYSGHGTRHKEPLYNDFSELADDMYTLMKQHCTDDYYAIFGYSMGTISTVEVLKQVLNKQEIKKPRHIFLAAHEPITKTEFSGIEEQDLDEWVKNRTIRFGTVPEKLVKNKSFWRMYLPLYRADYSIIGKYRFEELNLTTDIPVTVFYSETDTRLEDMLLWKNIFQGECCFYQFEGNHFFIQEHHKEMAEIITDDLRRRPGNDI